MPVSQSLPRCQERKTRGKMNQSGWLENFYISVDLAEREEGVWKRRGAEGGETEMVPKVSGKKKKHLA